MMKILLTKKFNICDLRIRDLFLFIFLAVVESFVIFGTNNFNLDEILLIICILLFSVGLLRLKSIYWQFLSIMILLFICGVLPFIFNGYSRSLFLIGTDFVLMFKFAFYFIGIYSFFDMFYTKFDLKKIFNLNYAALVLILIFVFAFSFYQRFILMKEEVTLFADYNGYIGIFLVFIEIYFIFYWELKRHHGISLSYRIFLITLLFLSMLIVRNSTSIITGAFVFLFYILKKIRLNFFATIIFFIFGSAIVFLIFYEKISDYFFNSEHPRFLLYFNSLYILIKFFPFGLGLSLYGTTIAANNYSPYYYQIGFDKRWGMNPQETFFLSDAYYPGIIGELGFIGLIFLILLILFMLYSLKIKKITSNNNLAILCLIVLLMNGITFNILNTLISFVLLFLAIYYHFMSVKYSNLEDRKLSAFRRRIN